jgi:hypothetical protein
MNTIVSILILTSLLLPVSAYTQPAELVHIKPPMSTGTGFKVLINNAIDLVQGTPEDLYLFKTIKVLFDYSEMKVCEFENMTSYLYHKTRRYNAEKADRYRQEWQEKTKLVFEAKFRESFDKKTAPHGMTSYAGPDTAAIQLVVKFIKLEPHCHLIENNNVPFVYMFCQFVGNDEFQHATYELTAFGSKDKNDAERVAECYAIAGKMLGAKIAGALLKSQRRAEKEALEGVKKQE